MKRFAILALVFATGAVAYAAVGDRLNTVGMFGWFKPTRSLPALRSNEVPFRYPAHLWRDGVEGEVILRVHITMTGSVDSVMMERSSGNEELDSIALTGARQLQYHPARQGETAVDVWAQLPVRFQRQFEQPTDEDGS